MSAATSRRQLLAGAAGALVATPAARAAEGVNPDAELLALEGEFERRWASERAFYESDGPHSDDELDAACEHTGEIAHRIVSIPATTVAGFRIKAQAIAWCYGSLEDMHHPVGGLTAVDQSTSTMMLQALVDNLLATAPAPPAHLALAVAR